MPIYEYRCDSCKHHLNELQKISDKPLVICPKCEKKSLRRLISAPVFRLKGSGWYETDFKSGNDKKRNLADNSDIKKVDENKNKKSDKITKSNSENNQSKESTKKKMEVKGKNDN